MDNNKLTTPKEMSDRHTAYIVAAIVWIVVFAIAQVILSDDPGSSRLLLRLELATGLAVVAGAISYALSRIRAK